MDVTTKIETITPEMAVHYLTFNRKNRNINRRNVQRMAKDMRKNNWRMTGESIKFSDKGNLIDGQHRLQAIIASGLPQKMLVIRNLSETVMDVIDTGAKRTMAHVLQIEEHKNGALLAGILKMAYFLDKGLDGLESNQPSHAELMDFYILHPELDEVASFTAGIKGKLQIYAPQSLLGLMRWATLTINKDMSDEFFELFKLPPQIETHPITVMRNILVSQYTQSRRKATRGYVAAILFKGWNAFYERREVKLLKYGVGEKFPRLSGFNYKNQAEDEV